MAIARRDLQYAPALRGRRTRRWDRSWSIGALTTAGLAVWLAYMLINAAFSWTSQRVDDFRYGYPRTQSIDGFIGYKEEGGVPTHFTVLNAHRQILITIVPGSDPTKVTVIRGPYLFGPGQEYATATLEVRDANHDAVNDLLLHVNGQTITYLNDPKLHTFVVQSKNGGTR